MAGTVPATRLTGTAAADGRTAHRAAGGVHPGYDLDADAAVGRCGEGTKLPAQGLATHTRGSRRRAADREARGDSLAELNPRCGQAATVAVAEQVAHRVAQLRGRGPAEANAQLGAEERGGQAGAVVARIRGALKAATAETGAQGLCPTRGGRGREARCRTQRQADRAVGGCSQRPQLPAQGLTTHTARGGRRTD